jgi:transposase
MSKFKDKKWFVGIDISKDQLDLALLYGQEPESLLDKRINNNQRGFNAMIQWLKKNKVHLEDCLFCMEHTGTYGLQLFAMLSDIGVDFCVEPGLQIKKSLGMTRGKNDRVDARRIAFYAFTNRSKLKPFTLPSKKLLQLKQLLTYRDQLVRMRTGFLNSVKSHEQYQQVTKDPFVTKQIRGQIDQLTDQVKQLEKQIMEIISSEEPQANGGARVPQRLP